MFSMNSTGEIIHENYLDKLPATNILNLEIMNSANDDRLHSLIVDDIKEIDEKEYQISKYRNIEKIFFKNLTKNKNVPVGYLSFSYNNKYILNKQQEEDVLRIMEKMSELL